MDVKKRAVVHELICWAVDFAESPCLTSCNKGFQDFTHKAVESMGERAFKIFAKVISQYDVYKNLVMKWIGEIK